ncbi:putative ubiquitin-conjugating enzyme E2 38 [Hibiscus syriacus]|nr:putative ubiquitin-conjugating enzyme E2 38 [Hibiscus syriacus]
MSSLLGTWHGEQNEMWVPGQSTMLQVLVSIQALILNATPFFNEPGYERVHVGAEGERKCRKYNEEVILSLKTMIYTLRKPPKHFEDFVTGHFRTVHLTSLCVSSV